MTLPFPALRWAILLTRYPHQEASVAFEVGATPEADLGCDVEVVVAHHIERLFFVGLGEDFASVKVDGLGSPQKTTRTSTGT